MTAKRKPLKPALLAQHQHVYPYPDRCVICLAARTPPMPDIAAEIEKLPFSGTDDLDARGLVMWKLLQRLAAAQKGTR